MAGFSNVCVATVGFLTFESVDDIGLNAFAGSVFWMNQFLSEGRLRFKVGRNVEVLEDSSKFFRYPLDVRNGDVDLVSVSQWFAFTCFLGLVRWFEGFVEGTFFSHFFHLYR